uniref:Kinase-like protein n=1 Tax=Mycena chlorophos TaxID=658473 RepID=A0ABQ0L3Q6_MYCCL|nr:kinase-like protein [Mycena chlorophos]
MRKLFERQKSSNNGWTRPVQLTDDSTVSPYYLAVFPEQRKQDNEDNFAPDSPEWFFPRFRDGVITADQVARLSVLLQSRDLSWFEPHFVEKGGILHLTATLVPISKAGTSRGEAQISLEYEVVKCLKQILSKPSIIIKVAMREPIVQIVSSLNTPHIPTRKVVLDILLSLASWDGGIMSHLLFDALEVLNASNSEGAGCYTFWFKSTKLSLLSRLKAESLGVAGAINAELHLYVVANLHLLKRLYQSLQDLDLRSYHRANMANADLKHLLDLCESFYAPLIDEELASLQLVLDADETSFKPGERIVNRRQPNPLTSSPESSPLPRSSPLDISRAACDELTDWQRSFETQTKKRMAECAAMEEGLRSEPGFSFLHRIDSKVYPNLLSFLCSAELTQDSRFQGALVALVDFIASLDLVWSLVQSAQLRVQLLKIAAAFNVSDDQRLRSAVELDERELGRSLQTIMEIDREKKRFSRLKGESAQCAVDLMQDLLDKRLLPNFIGSHSSLDSENFTLKARRLLVKLSEASDTLPSSLFIRDLIRVEQEASFGGTFGDIYRASYQGRDVALKRMRVFQRNSEWHKLRQRFCREALLWQRLRHPYVLPFVGIDSESFPSFLCMVSPWMKHGTIIRHLAENGNANVERRLFEIAQGLAYLHSEGVVHGDLRGANILVDDGWHACLADFGLAVFSDATLATHTSHSGGSVRWMSPELHFPQSCGLDSFRRTFASDVYSFAFVCIELVHGKPPFFEIAHDPAVMLRVLDKVRPARPTDPASGRVLISDWLWMIVQQCWAHDPAERLTMARVVEMMKDGLRVDG